MSIARAAVRSGIWKGIAIGTEYTDCTGIGRTANKVAENAIEEVMKVIEPLIHEPVERCAGEVYRDDNGHMVYVLSEGQIEAIKGIL